MVDLHIGNLIKSLISQKNISIDELAEKLHISKVSVYKVLKKKDINTEMLRQIASIINIDIRDFFGGSLEETVNRLNTEIVDLNKELDALEKEYHLLDERNLEQIRNSCLMDFLSEVKKDFTYNDVKTVYQDIDTIFKRIHSNLLKDFGSVNTFEIKWFFMEFIIGNVDIFEEIKKGVINYPVIKKEWVLKLNEMKKIDHGDNYMAKYLEKIYPFLVIPNHI